jgi:hypothetical protein
MFRDVWLPHPCVVDREYEFDCTPEHLYAQAGSTEIARWADWTDGVGETVVYPLGPPCGQFLLLSRDTVREFADRTKSRFSWICTLTFYYRKRGYGEFEVYQDGREYGAMKVIV